MKFSPITAALFLSCISLAVVDARPITGLQAQVERRDLLNSVHQELAARGIVNALDDMDLHRRGAVLSTVKNAVSKPEPPKLDTKASYPVGNNKPETPTGEFRKLTAGKHDDYFGDWESLTGGKGNSGVDNPAAGKGKKK